LLLPTGVEVLTPVVRVPIKERKAVARRIARCRSAVLDDEQTSRFEAPDQASNVPSCLFSLRAVQVGGDHAEVPGKS
jgi:hypothetical protein